MQLAPMRFTRIDGTAVSVSVTSAAEAKAALKELRHKKRELKFLRSALARQKKSVRAKENRGRRPPSLLRRLIGGIGWLIAALFERATVSKAERRTRSPAEIERELQHTDEILHNIQGCILQLEGKLLSRGRA
jgi:hypothetical protein